MKEVFIVESQTDANELIPCLAKFLKKGEYKTSVCKGHIREIREGNTYRKEKDYGINLNTYAPDYVIKDPKTVNILKKDIEGADMVYLVTDQDREGEAIAWHLKEVLGLKKYKRMPCYEYTYKTVKAAYDNAGLINENLVESQVGRAVLDKLVGYDLSPLIQKKFCIHSLTRFLLLFFISLFFITIHILRLPSCSCCLSLLLLSLFPRIPCVNLFPKL